VNTSRQPPLLPERKWLAEPILRAPSISRFSCAAFIESKLEPPATFARILPPGRRERVASAAAAADMTM